MLTCDYLIIYFPSLFFCFDNSRISYNVFWSYSCSSQILPHLLTHPVSCFLSLKSIWVQFLCWPITPGYETCSGVWSIYQMSSNGNRCSVFGELSNVISSSVALIPTSPPPCWDLSGSSLCRFGHAHTMLVTSYVPLPCCVWKSFLEVVHHLWLFLSTLLLRSLSLEGRGMIQMSHLGLNTPESYSLSIDLLYASVNFHLLLEGLKNMMFGFSSRSLGIFYFIVVFIYQNNSRFS